MVERAGCQTAGVLGRVLVAEAVALVVMLAACGGGGKDGAELSEQAAAGRTLALRSGCASCHGEDGAGDVGPPFIGLYGTNVELADGSTVVADDAYLSRSITEPGAEKVAGFDVNMPTNGLTDDEVAQIVTWIRELGPKEPGS